MKNKKFTSLVTLFATIATSIIIGGCGGGTKNPTLDLRDWDYTESIIDDKYRNFYEVYVRSYYDADGNGYGDLRGLGLKMEYIHDLGFNGVWMMPIHPSISYHKYDVDDYYGIDPEYGTMDDFEFMIQKANENNVAIVMDLVLNHSSARHEWFKTAVQGLKKYSSPGDNNKPSDECIAEYPTVNYYNFRHGTKPSDGVYRQVPGLTSWWYESWFSDNMPDLNLASEELKAEIVNIMRFWLEKGVKGFRLDAALHFFSAGATDKNTQFLSWLEEEAKKIYEDVYFVAEVWQGKEEQKYYSSGLDSFFNFSNSQGGGTVISSITGSSAAKFVNGVVDYQDGAKSYDEDAIVANFLGNHDMQRSANSCVNEINRDDGTIDIIIDPNYVKMSLGLNQMISGTSWVYYGEEISMLGHNGKSDPNYRTAMLWSDDQFELCINPPYSSTRVQEYEEGVAIGNVEEQLQDPNSVLNYLKIATRLRYKYPAIARGVQRAITFEESNEYAILEKTYNDEKLYLFINVDASVKTVELNGDLANLVVLDTLSTNGQASTLKKGVVKAAPYSITILK